MPFKLFRRGSARCIGLLSAFVTILLCLYYISMGQPSLQPGKDGAAISAAGLVGGVSNIGNSGVGGSNAAHLSMQHYNKNHAHKTRSNNNEHRAVATSFEQHNHKFSTKQQQQEQQQQQQQQQQQHNLKQSNANEMKNAVNGDATKAKTQSDSDRFINWGEKCYILDHSDTNITANTEYANFDFQPEWIRTKEYWDRGFEERFEDQKKDKNRPQLKVIIVPHSHNDPGWLRTFVNYFQSDSRQILNLIVTKLEEYKEMTFIWSEISFLQLWWDQAHPTKQRAFKRLLNSGRIEITTGGWVMTDEANVHIYAMLDQLIEGHQWLRNTLNITPTVGWSIDPFGHGSTVPYLLANSNFDGAIIQRIHYAWKQWFARQQTGDFLWTPYWQQRSRKPSDNDDVLLTHNMPFDIYSIKGSCGPHPFICLNFDFRKIPGEYTEYSLKAEFITNENVAQKAQLLLEQYARTASLFPHNVALIPVGDDFRYNSDKEVDQQYWNYKKLIDHIMSNKQVYNVDIGFGTPRDYFEEIRKRSKSFPTFKGDFFVYSDIFSEGRPAYWSGYYTTRPLYKILCADLEHNLRASEILFTIAYNTARQNRRANDIKIFEKYYEKLILARRNLGLFQHHDAITGTSKANVMRDYGMRLFESIQDVVKMQELTIELLLQNGSSKHNFLLSEMERDNFMKLPRKMPITLSAFGNNEDPASNVFDAEAPATRSENEATNSSFVIFNPMAQRRVEIITVRTTIPNVRLFDQHDQEILFFQINPVWNVTEVYDVNSYGGAADAGSSAGRIRISPYRFEIVFVGELNALSLNIYKLKIDNTDNYKRLLATVYCDDCTDAPTTAKTSANQTPLHFKVLARSKGDIQIQNPQMRLLFDQKTGFMKSIDRKSLKTPNSYGKPKPFQIKFAAYRSAQFHSGAYLFKPDPEQNESERNVLDQYDDIRIIITSGRVSSDVTVIYGPFLAHTVRIYNTHTFLDCGIFIENDIDFEPPPKNRETELFMRFITDIDNVETMKPNVLRANTDALPELPVFYTDQNGFQYHKRIKVPAIGIEGNYFPITSTTFLQDDKTRLTLLTTHAQGAASFEPGQLEVMLDRRTLYDDYRGMGEGITDSRLTRHRFWLLLEDMPVQKHNKYEVPSQLSQYLANSLRYPSNIYFVEKLEMPQLNQHVMLMGEKALPCDLHLMNLRTLSDEQLQMFPSSSALLVLHRQGYDCQVNDAVNMSNVCGAASIEDGLGQLHFYNLKTSHLETTTLTGTLPAQQRKSLSSFEQIMVQPMDLRTFNVTFE